MLGKQATPRSPGRLIPAGFSRCLVLRLGGKGRTSVCTKTSLAQLVTCFRPREQRTKVCPRLVPLSSHRHVVNLALASPSAGRSGHVLIIICTACERETWDSREVKVLGGRTGVLEGFQRRGWKAGFRVQGTDSSW